MCPSSTIIAVLLFAAAVNLFTSTPAVRTTTTQAVTYEQFLGIQIGWSHNQITQYLINNSGIVISEAALANVDIQFVQYTNPFGTVTLILRNDRLTSKSQIFLNRNPYPITKVQYDQITVGMNRHQVTSIVGNAGQVVGEGTNSVEIIGYNTGLNSFALIQITFVQGKVMAKSEAGL